MRATTFCLALIFLVLIITPLPAVDDHELAEAREILHDVCRHYDSDLKKLAPEERFEKALDAFANHSAPSKEHADELKASTRATIAGFEGHVKADASAVLTDQALVAFKAGQFVEAVRLSQEEGEIALGKMNAAAADEREPSRQAAFKAFILTGQAEFQQGGHPAALAILEKAATLADKERAPADWAEAREWMARVYHGKPDYLHSLALREEVLPVKEKLYGRDDPRMEDALASMVSLYYKTGRSKEALPFIKRILGMYEKKYGPDHLKTSELRAGLGTFYHLNGRSAEAEAIYRRTIAVQEKELGPDHLDLAGPLFRLGVILNDMKRAGEAEALFLRSLAIYEEKEPGHANIPKVVVNLADLYAAAKHFPKAVPLYRRAIALYEKQLGAEDPKMANLLRNLGFLLMETKQHMEEAEDLMKRSLAMDEKHLGPEHPGTALNHKYLALLYTKGKRTEEAEIAWQTVLDIRAKKLGPDHLNLVEALDALAEIHEKRKCWDDAEPLLKRALAILEKNRGPDHPDVASALSRLGKLCICLKQWEAAKAHLKRGWDICLNDESTPPARIFLIFLRMIENWAAERKQAEDEIEFYQLLTIMEIFLGPDHERVGVVLGNFAFFYHEQKRADLAVPLSRRALAIMVKNGLHLNDEEQEYFSSLKENHATYLEDTGMSEPEVQEQMNAIPNGEAVNQTE